MIINDIGNFNLPFGAESNAFYFWLEQIIQRYEPETLLNEHVTIYGAPRYPWNCGRPSNVDRDVFMAETAGLLRQNYRINLVANNYWYDDTGDRTLNNILTMLNAKAGNGVIISNDILLNYVKDKYPNLKTICSIVGHSVKTAEERTAEYYHNCLSKYDVVVVHPDDALQYSLLAELDTTRLEVLVNEHCVVNCQNRAVHYNCTARLSAGLLSADEFDQIEPEICACAYNKHRVYLAQAELQMLYKMGIRNWKVQGRHGAKNTLCYNILRFVINDKYVTLFLDRLG